MALNNSKLIEDELDAIRLQSFRRLQQNAFSIEFAVTQKIYDIAHGLYDPIRLKFGTAVPPQHPLQAIHLRFASARLLQYALDRLHDGVIEIGANVLTSLPLLKHPQAHGCCLFTMRDQVRYAASAAHPKIRSESFGGYNKAVQYLASGIEPPNGKFCVRGVQNCDKQANLMIAIHSLYDISIMELALAFHKHGAQELRAFMHMHPACLVTDKFSDSQTMTNFTIKNGMIRISFADDESFAYEHNADIFKFYHAHSGFSTPFGFGLTIEITHRYGSNTALTISRTDLSGHLTSDISMSHMNVIFVPNIPELCKQNRMRKVTTIAADRYMVTKLFRYLSARDPKQLNHRVAFSYARGQCRQVTLGNVIIDHAWDISLEDFDTVVLSVYIMAKLYALRHTFIEWRTTEAIEELTHVKSYWERKWPKITKAIKRTFEGIEDFMVGEKLIPLLSQQSDFNVFADLAFEFFRDSERSDYVLTDNIVREVQNTITPPTTTSMLKAMLATYAPPPKTKVKRQAPLPPALPINHEFHATVVEPKIQLVKSTKAVTFKDPIAETRVITPPTPSKVVDAPEVPKLSFPKTLTFDKSDNNSCLYYALFGPDADRVGITNELINMLTTELDNNPDLATFLLDYAHGKYPSTDVYTLLGNMRADMLKPTQRYVDDIALFTMIFPTSYNQITLHIDGDSYPVIAPVVCKKSAKYMVEAKDVYYENNHFTGSKPIRGGASHGFTVVETDIDFTEDHIIHGVHEWIRKGNGQYATYNGFAHVVSKHTPGGTSQYIKELAKHKQVKYLIDNDDCVVTTTTLFGPDKKVYNVIAKDYQSYKLRSIQWIKTLMASGLRDFTLHMPFVGSGVWKKKGQDVRDVILESVTYYQTLHDLATTHGFAIVMHAKDIPRFILKTGGNPHNPFTTLPRNDFHSAIKDEHILEELREIGCSWFNQSLSAPPELGVTLQRAADVFAQHQWSNPKFDCELIVGPPGAGKTTYVMKKNDGKRVLYVGPTNQLVADVRAKYPRCTALTLHKAIFQITKKYDLVVIDEAYTFPVAVLAFFSDFAPLALLGDPNQISYIDFTGAMPHLSVLKGFDVNLKKVVLKESFRCPRDILMHPLFTKLYPDCKTLSPVDQSIEYVGPKWNPENKKIVAQRIVLSQDAKKFFPNAITAHESQGQTFDNVIFTVTSCNADKHILQTKLPHLVVALSRHTKKLFVQEETPGEIANAITIFMGESVELHLATEATTTEVPSETLNEPDVLTAEVDRVAQVPYVPAHSHYSEISDVLATVYPTVSDIHEYRAVEKSDLEFKKGATGALNPDTLPEDQVLPNSKGKKFPLPQYVMVTESKRKSKAVHTLLSRYSKITKQLTKELLTEEVAKLQNIVHKYVPLTYTEDEKAEVFMDAIDTFQKRGHTVDDLTDMDCWTDQGVNRVEFNMKQQQKMNGSDPLHKDKAGQGIAAWNKTLNFAMCVWTRLLEKRMKESKKIVFCSGQSDTELLQLVDAMCTHESFEYIENDFSEFDSSQNNLEHENFLATLAALRCPISLLTHFREMMYKRDVSMSGATLHVRSKKDSGRVDTLCGNTLFNLSVLMSLFDEQSDIAAIYLKGDDSLVVGKNLRICPDRIKNYKDQCGYQLKIKAGHTAEFTHMIVNHAGAAINLPRLAAKTFSRFYKNETDLDNYRIAVADLLRTCNDTTTAMRTCKVNAIHHNITEDAADQLLSALTLFARGCFSYEDDLIDVGDLVKTQGI
jgi:hypothetical protein